MKVVILLSRHQIRESIEEKHFLTFFQHNWLSTWDSDTKSFPKGDTTLIFKVKQNNIIFILKNKQMEEEKGTQFTIINILATKAIVYSARGPDAQIHPLQLFLSPP